MSVLTLNNVTYKYEGTKKSVLKGVSAGFEAGRVYTIVGKSGSGKSTLLSLIAGLDVCEDGEILCENTDLKKLDRDEYRAKGIGVIFQSYNLITNSSAVENIVLSMNISGSKETDKKAFAYALLQKVGIVRETADLADTEYCSCQWLTCNTVYLFYDYGIERSVLKFDRNKSFFYEHLLVRLVR